MKLLKLSIISIGIVLSLTVGAANAQEDKAKAYTKKAIKYEKEGKFEKAIEYHSKAIELSPDNFNYYISRGVVELELKKNHDAIKDFTKAIELKSDFSLPYVLRGEGLWRQGKYKQALTDFETAHSIRPHKGTKKHIKELKKKISEEN